MVVNPTYEAYDNFKKKHLAQNREIIHKNTELSKLNAELNRTVTLLRAERLSLKGSHFQLECENASLRTALERAESRERELMARQEGQARGSWGGMDQDQVETMRRSLASAIATLNACGSILPSTGDELSRPSFVGSSPATPTPPTPASASSSASSATSLPPNANVSVSRRRSLASRAARETMTARPDLSYISEGGEGSAEMDDGGKDDGGWRGPVFEGLREESQPPSAFTSPAAAPSSTHYTSPAPEPTVPALPTPPPPLTSSPNPTLVALSLSSSSSSSKLPPIPRTAPPPAPSSASHQTSADRRPARRVSGLVRPPPPPPAPRAGGARARISELEEEGDGARKSASASGSWKGKEREALSEVQVSEGERAAAGARRSGSRQSRLSEMSSSSSEEEEDQSADDYEPEVPNPNRPPTPSPPRPLRPPPELSLAAAVGTGARGKKALNETVAGAASTVNPRKKVIELGPVDEEAPSSRRSSSRAADISDEVAPSAEPSEGRRARKSVNYALPKLNTKMRRPEDYVPLTSVHAKPRKSTLKPAHSSSSSTLAPPSLPRSSSGSTKPHSASGAPTPSATGGEEAGSDEDDEPDDVLPPRKSKAGQEMEERRRERALAAQVGGGAPKIGRRHSVAV